MTLSVQEQMDLRKLYAMYKGAGRSYITEEERSDYREKYPNTKISDLAEHIYTKNQLLFIEDAENQSHEINYGYSGRGMFGDVCPSIVCKSHNDITTIAKTRIDSMGLGIVIYAED